MVVGTAAPSLVGAGGVEVVHQMLDHQVDYCSADSVAVKAVQQLVAGQAAAGAV